MKSGPGQLGPHNGHSLMMIWLQINEIWAWPAGAQKMLFFNKNLIENQWSLGLASWGPNMVILQWSFDQWNLGLASWDPKIDIL